MALLWLFVINLGIAFGAGLYEHRIVVSQWVTGSAQGGGWDAEAVRRDDMGRYSGRSSPPVRSVADAGESVCREENCAAQIARRCESGIATVP